MNNLGSSRIRRLIPVIIAFIMIFMLAGMPLRGKLQEEQSWRADLNRNGIEEDYFLCRKQITICEDGKTIWQSPADWQVEQAIIEDVNNDGSQELVLLLWKQGNYGSSRPFWANKEDTIWSSHLFVYTLIGERAKQIWCSSALSPPLYNLQIITDPASGDNYLSAREGKLWSSATVHFKWDNWGFTYSEPVLSAP